MKADPPPGFRLTKWYLDAVADDGALFVGHQARLEWRGLSVRHASVLFRSHRGDVLERWASRGIPEPAVVPDGVRWSPKRPGVDGTWRGAVVPTPCRLFGDGTQTVDWWCHVPSAAARVALPGGGRLEGRGYVERLEMTVRPWLLPIEELRWGRFAGETESLVWVEWRGAAPLSLALRNGLPVPVASIGEEAVVVSGGEVSLTLTDRVAIREGPLGPRVLRRVPGLTRTLPIRALGIHETRWLSKGVLRTARGRSEGRVLHEVVRWP